MSLLVRLIIFPILLVRRILWPMMRGFLTVPMKVLGIFMRSSLFIYLISFVILYVAVQVWMGGSDKADDSDLPPLELSKEDNPATRAKITVLPEIKVPVSDGNSMFAKGLEKQMTKDEQKIYWREFNYALQYVPEGEAHLWKTPQDTMFGKIEAKTHYTTKSGIVCRSFTETLFYRGKAQNVRGKSCQRTDAPGWCKLRPESTPRCEIGYSPGTWQSIKNDVSRWFNTF